MTALRLLDRIRSAELVSRTGRVTKILPTYIEADGPAVARGALCAVEVRGAKGAPGQILAQVVSVNASFVVLAPFETGAATFQGARVIASEESDLAPVGDGFLGRAVDPFGRPLDGGRSVFATRLAPVAGAPSPVLDRVSSGAVLPTGVRAIDTFLTFGRGQRVGVFAAAGVGKTTLLTQLARQIDADCCVICLVGERGREVEALWSQGLAPEVRAKTVLVAATSDEAAAMRARACDYALTLAEHWRGQGKNVLLLLDSVTRLAMALREVGLAAGEPPTVRAYTPGVFAAIPRIVERCGAVRASGSITAIMTVLSETDEIDDPVSEMMRSLLDGHIVLSRKLAEQGHFPAIDVPRSISRLANDLNDDHRRSVAERGRALLSTYEQSRTLIETGVYVRDSNPLIDEAIDLRPGLVEFLQQRADETVSPAAAFKALSDLVDRRRRNAA